MRCASAKKLRYLIDVTPAFYAKPISTYLGALKKLQGLAISTTHIRRKSGWSNAGTHWRRGGPAGALFALGRLAAQSRQRRESLRGHVVEGLMRFRARSTRLVCRRAFKRADVVESAP
jgi:hypothetical protein